MLERLAIALLAVVAIAGSAFAQEKYPSRVIRFVTAAPGSNHDWGARITANELGSRIGQRVIVENRGSISIEYVAKEVPADGYTVLFYGAVVWLQPFLRPSNWDPLADFTPVTLAITSPNVLVVHPSLPVKNVKEMIALARSKLTPDLPTVAETVPGYVSEAAIGFFLPKRTSPAIVSWLNKEIAAALRATDAEKIANAGVEIVANSPDEFTAFIKADMARMSDVMKGGSFRE